MRIRDIVIGLSAILGGTIILNIFLPWWLVVVLMGLVTVLAVQDWIIKIIGLDPAWGKRIVIVVIAILLISLTITHIEQKSPWLVKAMGNRGLYLGFKATDRVDPKYPEALAMALYRLKMKLIEMEEIEQARVMDVIYEKIEAGGKPNQNDWQTIKTAEKKLLELDKKSATNRLSRPNGKAWFESIRAGTLISKIFWLGVIFLAGGLILQLATKKAEKKRGRTVLGLGAFSIFLAIALALFEPELESVVQAMKNIPKAKDSTPVVSVKPVKIKQTQPSRLLTGTIEIPAGTGQHPTNISFKKGMAVCFKSESKLAALVWDETGNKSIKIPHRWQCRPCNRDIELTLKKRNTPTRLSYKIRSF